MRISDFDRPFGSDNAHLAMCKEKSHVSIARARRMIPVKRNGPYERRRAQMPVFSFKATAALPGLLGATESLPPSEEEVMPHAQEPSDRLFGDTFPTAVRHDRIQTSWTNRNG